MSQPLLPTLSSPADQTFPTLTPAQIARIEEHGSPRPIRSGEVLVEAGDHEVPFYVVKEGRLNVVRPGEATETLVATHGPGQFTGEVNMLSGRRALLRTRVAESGEVIRLDRECLLGLVQVDPELSEIFMRAFIFRRLELIAHGIGDVVLVGSNHCSGTLRIREFLTRNGHPYAYIDVDHDPGVQELLDQFHVTAADMPVLICRGELVLRNPTNQQVAECLGFNDEIDASQIRDLVILGAGPAGLAAAVYGASEGLDVLVLESMVPGGQAGSSSKIENYLGFPTGISGQELTARAFTQAQKFGAGVLIAKGAVSLHCASLPYRGQVDDGPQIATRTIILATGAEYRRPPIENLARFQGAGVYYSATPMEAQLCTGEEVIVVGGGNSAGQAAVYLAPTVRRVYVL